jgi:tetratricopeptide (TPR) repeat protein
LTVASAWEWRSGRPAEAAALVERGLIAAPNAPGLLAWRAILERDAGRPWQETAGALRRAETDPFRLWTTLIEAVEHVDAGRWPEARAGLNALEVKAQQTIAAPASGADPLAQTRVVEAGEAAVLAGHLQGVVDRSLGDWRPAVQRWMSVADAEPGWTLPLVNAADTLLERGQVDQAVRAATRAFAARRTGVEAMTLARASVAQAESMGPGSQMTATYSEVLDQLEKVDAFRAEALLLRLRAALIAGDQEAARRAGERLGEVRPPLPPARMVEAANRLRAAGVDGADALLAAAEKSGAGIELASVRVFGALDEGKPQEALALARAAGEGKQGLEAVPYRLLEARVLAQTGAASEAREILRALSDGHATAATVQLDVLAEDAAWVDADLIETAVRRLRAATGDAGVEWQLAEATRLLTFSPDPAKAQDMVVRLTRIARVDPQNVRALVLLSDWMEVLDDNNAAADALTRAADTPDAPLALQPKLIDLLRRAGRVPEARERLERFTLVERIPAELRRARAELSADLGLDERAAADRRALAREGRTRDRLAWAAELIRAGDAAEGVKELDGVLATPGLERSETLAVLSLLIDAGRAERAITELAARGGAGAAFTPLERASILERAGRIDEAGKILADAAAGEGKEAAPAIALANFHMRRGAPDRARAALAAAKSRGIASPDIDATEALIQAREGGPLSEAQESAVIAALPAGPSRDLAEATRWYDEHRHDRDGFLARLRRVTAADPTMLLAWELTVRTHLELGQPEQAVTAARAASSALPRSPDAARLEAQTLHSTGRASEARAPAARWRQLDKDSPEPVLLLAQIDAGEGNDSDAAALLESLVAAPSASAYAPEVWTRIIAGLAGASRTERAKALAKDRGSGPAWAATLASIAGSVAKPFDQARAWLVSIEPDLEGSSDGAMALSEAYGNLASRSGASDDLARAWAILAPVVEPAETDAVRLTVAGDLLVRLERWDDAAAMYKRAIARDGGLWVPSNNLAYLALLRGMKAHDALALATRAVELAEASGVEPGPMSRALHTLAFARLRAGKAQEALDAARRSTALDAGFGDARVVEAEALEALGERDRAKPIVEDVLRRADAKALTLDAEARRRATALLARLSG